MEFLSPNLETGVGKRRPAGRRRGALVAAAVTLALALLAWRWREAGFNWSEFSASLRQLRWPWVAVSAGFALLTYAGRAVRWQVLLRPVKPRASFRNLLAATVIGFTAIVLFGRAGEPVRPYLIAVKERVSFSSQVAAWLIERIYDLLTALLIFGFALSQIQRTAASVGPGLEWVLRAGGWAAGFVGVVTLAVLLAFTFLSEPMRHRLRDALAFLPEPQRAKADRIAGAFAQGLASTRNGAYVALLIFYSLVEWVLIILSNAALFRASPATEFFTLREVIIFVGFVAFGGVVQIPGIGGGVQVVTVVVLRELFGVGLEAAAGLALLVWVVSFVVIVPVGLIVAFHEGLTLARLRKLEQQVAAL